MHNFLKLPCNNFILAFVPALLISAACAGKEVRVASPDGHIRFVLSLTDSLPLYSVYYNNTILIESSPLDLSFLEPGESHPTSPFGQGFILRQPVLRAGEDHYTL